MEPLCAVTVIVEEYFQAFFVLSLFFLTSFLCLSIKKNITTEKLQEALHVSEVQVTGNTVDTLPEVIKHS